MQGQHSRKRCSDCSIHQTSYFCVDCTGEDAIADSDSSHRLIAICSPLERMDCYLNHIAKKKRGENIEG